MMSQGGGVGSGDTEVGRMATNGMGVLAGDTNAPVLGSRTRLSVGLQLTDSNNARNASNPATVNFFEGIAMGHLLITAKANGHTSFTRNKWHLQRYRARERFCAGKEHTTDMMAD